jgi:hypothetical protein
MQSWENRLATELNNGGFQLSVVASYAGVGSVKYLIRIEKPNWERVDYVSSLAEFKRLGELFLDLYSFAKDKEQFDENKLRETLTADNIREYANLKKAVKINQL